MLLGAHVPCGGVSTHEQSLPYMGAGPEYYAAHSRKSATMGSNFFVVGLKKRVVRCWKSHARGGMSSRGWHHGRGCSVVLCCD